MSSLNHLMWDNVWSRVFPNCPPPVSRRTDPRLLAAVFLVPLAFALVAWAAYGSDLFMYAFPPGLPFYPAVAVSLAIGVLSDGWLRGFVYTAGSAVVYLLLTGCIVLAQFVAALGDMF
jgi:hypothetical protein